MWEAAADASCRPAPGSAARSQPSPPVSLRARATGVWDILATQSRSPTLRSALLADDLSEGSQGTEERSADDGTSLLSLPGARRAWDSAAAAVLSLPSSDASSAPYSGSSLRRRRGWSSGPSWTDTTVVFKPLLMVDDSMLDGERKPSSVIRNRRIQEIRQSRREARSSATRSSMGATEASPSAESADSRGRLRADSSGAGAPPPRRSPLFGGLVTRSGLTAPLATEPVPRLSPGRHTGASAASAARPPLHSRSRSAPHARGSHTVLRFQARWALMAGALLGKHGLQSPRQSTQILPRFPPLGQHHHQQQFQPSNQPAAPSTRTSRVDGHATSLSAGRTRRRAATRQPPGRCHRAWVGCFGAVRPSSNGFHRMLHSELAVEAAAGSDPHDPLRDTLARAALLEAVQHTVATLGPASPCRSLGFGAARLAAAWVVVAGAGMLGLRALLSGVVLCTLMLPGSVLDVLVPVAPRFGEWVPGPIAAWSDFAGLMLATSLLLLGADRARQIVGDTVDSTLALAAGAADAVSHFVSGCRRVWAPTQPANDSSKPPIGGSPATTTTTTATPTTATAPANSSWSNTRPPRHPGPKVGRDLTGCGRALTTWRLLGRLVLLSAIALVWPALATWTGVQASGRAAASFAAHVVHLPVLSSPAMAAVMALLYGAILAATALREAQRIAAACCVGGCARAAIVPPPAGGGEAQRSCASASGEHDDGVRERVLE